MLQMAKPGWLRAQGFEVLPTLGSTGYVGPYAREAEYNRNVWELWLFSASEKVSTTKRFSSRSQAYCRFQTPLATLENFDINKLSKDARGIYARSRNRRQIS